MFCFPEILRHYILNITTKPGKWNEGQKKMKEINKQRHLLDMKLTFLLVYYQPTIGTNKECLTIVTDLIMSKHLDFW